MTVSAVDFNDVSDLAERVITIYDALSNLSRDDLPARPEYLDFTFESDTDSKRLRTTFDQIKAALADGLSGAALFVALGGLS